MNGDALADVHAVEDIVRRIESAENAGRSDDIEEMMADDAVIMVPSQPVQEGKAACAGFVREVLRGLLEQFNRRITYVSAEVRIIGEFAFDRGKLLLHMLTKIRRRINERSREIPVPVLARRRWFVEDCTRDRES